MKTTFLLFLNILFFTAKSQAPFISWEHSLGGTNDEDVQSIQQTTDGGYIVAGSTRSNDGDISVNKGGSDVWVVKLNLSGAIQWQKTYGGTGDDNSTFIQQTSDGGYILAANTTSNDGDIVFNHGSSDVWILKLDPSGNTLWEQTYGGGGPDFGASIQQTNDGGYIFSGSTYENSHGGRDYWVMKLMADGQIDWQDFLGGSANDIATKAVQTTDGGYIVSGYSSSTDGQVTGNHDAPDPLTNANPADFWIVKLGSDGTLTWEKSFGGTKSDRANSIQQTTEGGYIVIGYSNSFDGDVTGNHGNSFADFWLVKITDTGNLEWEKSLGGSQHNYGEYVQQTSDGGFIATGQTDSGDGDVSSTRGSYNYWVVKLISNGTIQWQETLGGNDLEEPHVIQQTQDGGFIVAGFSNSNNGDVSAHHGSTATADGWVVKLAPTVNVILPLHWNFIKGSLISNGETKVDWETTNEENVDKYIVEISDNSLFQFREIGHVNPQNKGIDDYSFASSFLGNGNYYFRIKCLYSNGRFEYSPVINVKANIKGIKALMTPNPVVNSGSLEIQTDKSMIAEVSFLNEAGNAVLVPLKRVSLSVGNNYFTINTSSLASGIYWCQIRLNNGEMKIFKFIKN